jgi:hypothetical protein
LLKNWTGNLNGTGVVNLDGQWSRVFRGYNDGSTSFAGTINLHASGDPSLSYLKIISTDNQTLMAIYTIPGKLYWLFGFLQHDCPQFSIFFQYWL